MTGENNKVTKGIHSLKNEGMQPGGETVMDNKIKVNREIISDLAVAILAIIALGACCFFRGCKYDLLVTVLGIAVVFSVNRILVGKARKDSVNI